MKYKTELETSYGVKFDGLPARLILVWLGESDGSCHAYRKFRDGDFREVAS